MVKEWTTSVAAAYVELPAWLVANVQVPTVSIDTLNSETVHTSCVVDVSVTGRFEFDVGFTVKGVEESSLSMGSVNVMV